MALMSRLRLRTKLVLLPLVVLIPLLMGNFVQLNFRFRESALREQLALQDLSRTTAASFRNYLENIWDTEKALGEAIFHDAQPLTPPQASLLFDKQMVEHPTLDAFEWITPEGQVIASSLPTCDVSIKNRESFQRILAGQNKVIGDLVVSGRTGDMLFGVLRAIRNTEGGLLGVISARVNIERLGQAIFPVHANDASYSVLTDSKGRIVVRSIPTNLTFEQRLIVVKDGPAWMALAAERDSFVDRYKSHVDGVLRMGATTFLPDLGWTVSEVVALDHLYSPVWRSFCRDVVWIAAGVVVALTLGFLLVKDILQPIRTLADATRALASGDLSARTSIVGNDEISLTAQAFDQMAASIERLESERDELVQMAAHELRNPMAVVKSTIGLLRVRIQRGTPPVELLPYLDVAERELDRTSDFLGEFVDTFRIQQGRMLARLEPVEVVSMVAEAIETHSLCNDQDKHTFVLESDAQDEVLVKGDVMRLEQVFDNLIANAVKFSPDGGTITVSVNLGEDSVIVSVKDTGMGIPENELPRVFEAFYQASNTTGHDLGGAGLGLFICKEIVDLHGGRIWVQSRKGEGTTFFVELPLYRGATEAAD